MGLVRILVDGYSLLYSWPGLAPRAARHSAAAREELVHILSLYHDATGTPVTIIFDGVNAFRGGPDSESSPEVEVLYSKAGQTADEMLERAAHRLSAYGEVLVVTNDRAERETVNAVGGMTTSCENFIGTIKSALADFDEDLARLNSRERRRFRQV